ncbi:mCG144564, isoform CRA_b, partial [Mus musculus]
GGWAGSSRRRCRSCRSGCSSSSRPRARVYRRSIRTSCCACAASTRSRWKTSLPATRLPCWRWKITIRSPSPSFRMTMITKSKIALAPYQHLEEDMQSLKQVLEMKNQQIHLQEKKIIELEKLVEKNIILEERIQVLQQQNEDLKARIDQNTVVTRQLSEENANLQEYVEKETQEKKRLSRTNEELLWKLQTGDPTSPIKLSPTSPVYRGSSSGPSSPARVSTTPR